MFFTGEGPVGVSHAGTEHVEHTQIIIHSEQEEDILIPT